ncbi:MAG: hypothetical protein HYT80_06245 [Euryarchaeota archaeon]|nr:hypothetical protein [Euryarchaeota archaeon]
MARVFPWEAVREEVKARLRARNEKWEASPTAKEWVEDFYPAEWARVEGCRLVYDPKQSKTFENKWALRPYSCQKIPWCVPCSLDAGRRRTWRAMEDFQLATTPGQRRLVVPWTLAAAYYDDGTGVGAVARKDLERFAKAVSDFLHQLYEAQPGELGWIMSYQDFGERAFKKPNPHWHITMNGHYFRDGKMEPLPRVSLKGKGRERVSALWDAALGVHLGFDRTTGKLVPKVAGNSRVEEPAVGRGAFFKWLKYETRELIDLRKLVYSRQNTTVAWYSYHDRHERTYFHSAEFFAGLQEYRRRLRPDESNRLHRQYGYMVGRKLAEVSAAIGSEAELHDPLRCACDECHDWFGRPDLRDQAMGRDQESWIPKRTEGPVEASA